MVMAGTEGVSGPSTDESFSSRLQWLRQRREALQDKLAQKNNELKTLCIEEAELTGVLPPEIPLEPGESPPTFRKRVGTSFTYPQNMINKLKTNEAEESKLELERQVQIGIQEAALAIINDSTENKAVRRKHRLIYQQSKQRLQDIDVCLNFIRQSHGSSARHTQGIHFQNSQSLSHNSKHRTKKPRPPLDNLGREKSIKHEVRGSLQDQGGISLSPLGPEHNYNVYSREFQEHDTHQFMQPGSSSNSNQNRTNYIAASPVDVRRNNTKFHEHDVNVNNNVYILPDQFRSRTYSQGASTSPLRQNFYQDVERPYRPVPNTFTEEERQYRQMQMQKLEMHSPSYSEKSILRHLDNDSQRRMVQTQYYESEYNSPSRYEQTIDYQSYGKAPLRHRRERDHATIGGIERKHHSAMQPNVDTYLPPGYWMRLDDEIVFCPEEQNADRFGSLDRRKQTNSQYYPNPEIQTRYNTVASGSKNIILPRQHSSQVPINSSEHTPSNRILIRTQSLGSVETWHAGHDLSERDQADNLSRKGKEKEWYETSLDSRCSPNIIPISPSGSFIPNLVRRPSQNSHPPPPPPPPPSTSLLSSSSSSLLSQSSEIPIIIRENEQPPPPRRPRELPLDEQSSQCNYSSLSQNHYHERPKVLEIPAESKPSTLDNGNDPILTSFNSPTNHTIVQQGKYQPYREVTKPFEMSDFYKYSTKFRKRNETSTTSSTSSLGHNSNVQVNSSEIVTNIPGNDKPRRVSPVQKTNYQPNQRKPQMYALR
ncbi:uncharacterized protein LOC122510469 [Leptopilina heterotoma]|uniref:uncharacterized protein LOC122510469 n=1 Tax=Leptopilina heterotoma TaxID=63436 RepID=UPI001CA7CC77|nr:uncharacterized protein LOC122510469 [Leptopilina heterotoma]XP_043481079.1 uncharacterized protein LOC122510469 [Leptopilina heterotoma]